MENFIEAIEAEIIPALEIIQGSLAKVDDTIGQQVLLDAVIKRLRQSMPVL